MRDSFMECICGQEVAVPHADCMALLTEEQRRSFTRGRLLENIEDEDDEYEYD